MPGSSELEGGAVRASDRDRATVVAELEAHSVEGRISVDELERRTEQVMSSVTIHDLAEVVWDLPSIWVPSEQPRRPTVVRVGGPGSRPFTRRIVVPLGVERVRTIALDTISPALNAFGFELSRQSSSELRFERSIRSGGLLGMLTAARKESIVISLERKGSNETTMIVHGRAPRRVRKAFAVLTFD